MGVRNKWRYLREKWWCVSGKCMYVVGIFCGEQSVIQEMINFLKTSFFREFDAKRYLIKNRMRNYLISIYDSFHPVSSSDYFSIEIVAVTMQRVKVICLSHRPVSYINEFPVVQMYSETLKFISRFWYINNERRDSRYASFLFPLLWTAWTSHRIHYNTLRVRQGTASPAFLLLPVFTP